MEKYGTIPPRFTKAWFSHYWFYYKWHLIIGVSAIAIIGGTVSSCLTAPKYDLQAQYMGSYLPENAIGAMEAKLSELSADITDNKKVEVSFVSQSSLGDGDEYAEYNYALTMKTVAELQTAEIKIYLMDKNQADFMSEQNCFMPVSEWADSYSEEMLYNDSVLSLAGNKYFSELGFNTDDLYIGVLSLYERFADDEYMVKNHKNAINVANQLIKE